VEQWLLYVVPAAGILALLFAFYRATWVAKQDAGTKEMVEIAGFIKEGAMAFLNKEYKVMSVFVVITALLLGFLYFQQGGADVEGSIIGPGQMALVALSFVLGAVCSGLAGYFGMRVATTANVRTTNAARTGLTKALDVSFSGGAVMGMSVVGLAMLGMGILLLLYSAMFGIDLVADVAAMDAMTRTAYAADVADLLAIVTGFSLGASSIALFARVGGGIYTKAADVGADLVGKVEAGIPEDDPRNPATIADNVGDNVGDVAGMGADLFESYVGSIIGSMVLGLAWALATGDNKPLFLPLMIASVGIVVSIACTFLVRVQEGGNPGKALHTGTISAAVITAAATAGLVMWAIPAEGVTVGGTTYSQLGPFWATLGGLVAGTLIGLVTEYYTSDHFAPVQQISKESEMGYAPNIIAGLGLGMISTAVPVLLIVTAIGLAYSTSGLYGIALAALGMLATTGIQLAVDAFGPIADNAGGIAEMSELPPEVRERTDKLDSVGNTTAAIGKGFAIGSAALTALALFSAFTQQANLPGIDLLDPRVMIGVFIGAIMPFVFSALAMKAVGRSAGAMIEEVRRQFREIPGLLEGKAKAEYAKCVDISTQAALKEMIAPGLLAIAVAVIAGFWDPVVLGGVLAGVTTSGVAMAIFMSNAGGAWDNAKKYIEAGHHGGKGSDAHKAAVAGDTVGDPFKDTAGPSLNILIKLMSVVALVLAPIIAVQTVAADAETAVAAIELQVEEAVEAVEAVEDTAAPELGKAEGQKDGESAAVIVDGNDVEVAMVLHHGDEKDEDAEEEELL
jgi:K(+)-stimulated pyrophosphate-energized sodium pump